MNLKPATAAAAAHTRSLVPDSSLPDLRVREASRLLLPEDPHRHEVQPGHQNLVCHPRQRHVARRAADHRQH